ncbi:asparaginase [Fervidobacterium sp. 2310opik-2]|uniref:asparaginase n=1 Tax=Fervidobacterium sp. 2310opik-2 TaxID=1755815 RepID=UPI0013E0D1B6|nr:asparaginase [Fervidobacterium sp. 2310opik-2]KAF2962408.1 L-asparaginase [Fervidobacterium sp. 2310opik-2]
MGNAKRKKIVIVSTGGTIAMIKKGRTVVPFDKGNALVTDIPELYDIADIEVYEFSNVPSPYMTPNTMWELAKKIDEFLEEKGYDGVVVTHGTDTLEETAYFLDLVLKTEKPVVLTASMRNIGELSTDGPRNVLSSVMVAACDESYGMGVVVCLNDEIHAAREVTKTYTSNVATFDSPGYGPLGIVDENNVIYIRKSLTREKIITDKIEEKVAIVKTFTGDDGSILRAVYNMGYKGIVLEGFGRGNVPPQLSDVVEEITKNGVPIIVTSRCFKGRVYPIYGYTGGGADLRKRGAILSEHPLAQKARIKLMVVLGKTNDLEEIRKYFEKHIGGPVNEIEH